MMEFIKTQTGLKLKVNPSEFDSYRLYASLKADPNGFETLAGVQYSRKSVRKFKQYFSKFNMCYPLYGKRLRFLGYVGVTELIDNNEAVIEFYIVKKHRNKGYAYEACRALMKYTVSFYKGLNKFTALCSVDNLPSQNLLKKLGFEAIISEEQWNKCNELLAKRRIVSKDKFGNTTSTGYNPSADLWQRKLRCTCGSKFRKNVYHKHDDGSKTFCYICYNKLNHGNAANRKKAGLETEGYCDNKTVLQWKMDMMGEFIFNEHWANRAKDMQDALEYIKKYYTQSAPEAVPTFDYEAEITKLERKLDALIDMRTDGEITKEEYNKKRAEYEAQIKNLRSQATSVSPATPKADALDLDKIISALNDISDSKTELGREVLEDIVSSVIPTSEGVYEWHLSTGADTETQTNLAVKGRANSKERPYVYLYGEEADKTASDVHNICILNFDCLRRLLHRLLSLTRSNQSAKFMAI